MDPTPFEITNQNEVDDLVAWFPGYDVRTSDPQPIVGWSENAILEFVRRDGSTAVYQSYR